MKEVKTEYKKWCVYMHTNKINNKVYVGITKEYPIERRWRSDGSGYLHKNVHRHSNADALIDFWTDGYRR